MNCRQFRNEQDEYLEGTLARGAHDAAAAHLRECRDCQRHVARAQSLRAALRNLPVPATRPAFFDEALRRAQRLHDAKHRRWPQFAGMALAASLALWLGFGWLPDATRPPASEPAGMTIALHEIRHVQLAFHAERALSQATLSISLPDGIELQGFPGQREVRWQTDLARGVNVLSLPLIAVSTGRGSLLARLQHGDRGTELTVPLRVGGLMRTSLRNRKCTPETAGQTASTEEIHAYT